MLWFFFFSGFVVLLLFFSKFLHAKKFWQRGQLVDTIITPQVFWVQAGAYMQVCQTHRRLTRPSGTLTSTVNWHKAGSLHVGLLFAVRGEGLYWLKGLLPQLRPWDTDSFNKVEWIRLMGWLYCHSTDLLRSVIHSSWELHISVCSVCRLPLLSLMTSWRLRMALNEKGSW